MIRELTESELKQRELLNERLKGRKPKENNAADDCANPILDEDNPFITNSDHDNDIFKLVHEGFMKMARDCVNQIELLPPPGSGLTYRIDESGYIHCEEYKGDE
jgi:hypothetical protein